jgi:hypothetical protein
MAYSRKRQQFLVNQGYAYKVVNKIPAMEQEPNLGLASDAEQAQLLQQVIQASEKDLEDEETVEDDGIVQKDAKVIFEKAFLIHLPFADDSKGRWYVGILRWFRIELFSETQASGNFGTASFVQIASSLRVVA